MYLNLLKKIEPSKSMFMSKLAGLLFPGFFLLATTGCVTDGIPLIGLPSAPPPPKESFVLGADGGVLDKPVDPASPEGKLAGAKELFRNKEYSKAEKTSETSEGGDSKSDKMINYSDTIEGGDSKADKTEGGDSKADKMINYSDIMDDKMINYSEMINYSDILVEGGDSKADKMINYSDLVDDYDESDSKAGKLSEEEGSAKAGKTSDTAEGKARKLLKLR